MQKFKPILTALYVLYLRAVRAFFSWRVRVWAHAVKRATAGIYLQPQSFAEQGENLAYYRGKVEGARAKVLWAGAELELIAERGRAGALAESVRMAQAAVRAFHKRFDIDAQPIYWPAIGNDVPEDRYKIMHEELEELRLAMECGDTVGSAREIADLLYTVLGTAVAIGIDLGPVFAEVHRANMAKEKHPQHRHGGPSFHMIVKPAGWKPPRVGELVAKQYRARAVKP